MATATAPMSWAALGVCGEADTKEFYPDDSGAVTVYKRTKAKYCDRCPVQAECRQYALDNEIDAGMWGGTKPSDRERLLRLAEYNKGKVHA